MFRFLLLLSLAAKAAFGHAPPIPTPQAPYRVQGTTLRDAKGEERKVVLLSEKPQDFEMSEQIVLTGKMKGEEFIASEVLLKCPSKYKDEEIYIKGKES